jgi:N-acetylglucosamine-6-phosphate deacetylase
MSDEKRLLADHVVVGDGVFDQAYVVVRDGRIAEIVPREPGSGSRPVDSRGPAAESQRLAGWLVPGFVDTHNHGGGGADFATTDPDEVRRAVAFHLAHGTTATLASLVTAAPETYDEQLATLAPLVAAGELAGVHLEGPFLSPEQPGAHDPTLLARPSPEAVERLIDAGAGSIRMVTLAPELPGGLAAIERLVEAGVVVAFGHSDADEGVVRDAIGAGARVATHLFNAMRPIHHREPGPVPRLLTDPRVTVELICDGFHLHPDVIAMAVDTAGPARVALVTDAMLAAGAAGGRYQLGSLAVEVTDGQARLVDADGSLGSIAGSTLTMGDAFELVVSLGIPIVDAARMAATTPADRHGLVDVGVIEPGRRADFCLVDDDGRLQRVMRAGHWV